MTYYPDKWVVVKIIVKGEDSPLFKVMGSFYGDYTGGDSYRLNSGIIGVVKDANQFIFYGHSMSEYYCHNESYGMHMFSIAAVKLYQEQLKPLGHEMIVLDEEEWKKELIDAGIDIRYE